MADLTIRIENLDEVLKRFDSANPVVQRELHTGMTRAVMGELERMPPYPPPPLGSTYIRTHLLDRSLTAWIGQQQGALSRVEGVGDELRGIVGTAIPYAPWVIGRGKQAWMHRDRWWILEDTVMSHKAEIEAEFERVAERLAQYLGD